MSQNGNTSRAFGHHPTVDVDLAGPGRWRDGPNTVYLTASIADDDPAIRVTVTGERTTMASAVLTWREALALHTSITKAVYALDPTHRFDADDAV